MALNSAPHLGCLLLSLSLFSCSTSPGVPPTGSSPSRPAPPPIVSPEGPPPEVVAESVIVIDAVSGRILGGKNEDERRAVASTQKLLTALLVVEAGPLSNPLTIDESDTRVEPTKLYLKPGHRYTRGELLKAILVRSANDASMALARDVAGDVDQFANLMNRRARSLGMFNSHFRNPHGLTEPGQFSTARDMAKLARVAYQRAPIRAPMTIREYTFVHEDGKETKLVNTNKLLKRLPYTTGMKTGTTRASGKCLIASGTRNGRTAIAVVLGSTSNSVWSDSEKLLRWALELPTPSQAVTSSN